MDNAFERARAAYGTGAYDDATLEFLFPQLKESEDEKIREWLVDYFAKIGKSWIHREFTCEQIIAYLEKQKENSKSADFISSNCASGAKCENRWHKVGDSLPDNGREVLAKDKLGNTLLARYDGEGWDVSVYDDKDYRCHNGISKWCEIPSEKQKDHFRDDTKMVEQKPAEWSKEDERIIDTIVSVLGQYIDYKAVSGTGSGYATPRYSKEIDWLKSLRPSWRPSEEQMKALNALNLYGDLSYVGQQNQLISLYQDLKKLM